MCYILWSGMQWLFVTLWFNKQVSKTMGHNTTVMVSAAHEPL
jgi:hypothetical protein